MSDRAKTALCLLVIFAAYGIVGRGDYEEEGRASAIRLACTPILAQKAAGAQLQFQPAAPVERDPAPRIFRCVVVG